MLTRVKVKVGCPELLVDNKSAIDTIVFGNFSPKASDSLFVDLTLSVSAKLIETLLST